MQFTDAAGAALTAARDEAHLYGSSVVRHEHILLGILDQESCTAVKALRLAGALRRGLRPRLTTALGEPTEILSDRAPTSYDMNRLRRLGEYEALALSHSAIGTEHLLLGLIRGEEGFVAELLREVGAGDLDVMRDRVIEARAQR